MELLGASASAVFVSAAGKTVKQKPAKIRCSG